MLTRDLRKKQHLFWAQSRHEQREYYLSIIDQHLPGAAFLSNEVQNWGLRLLRSPDELYDYSVKRTFDSIAELRKWLSQLKLKIFGETCCLFAYEPDDRPAILAHTADVVRFLSGSHANAFRDGFIISNCHFSRFLIVDYDGDDFQRNKAEAELSGDWGSVGVGDDAIGTGTGEQP